MNNVPFIARATLVIIVFVLFDILSGVVEVRNP